MTAQPAHRRHLADVLGWSGEGRVGRRAILVAALAMSAPVLIGLAVGRPQIGFTIGLGAMLLAGETPASTAAEGTRPSPASAILPAALAVVLATLIAGQSWTDAAMILLVGAAATVSGYSRPVAVGAIRFLVYLVLAVTLIGGAGAARGWAALVFGLGAGWNLAVRTMLAAPKTAPSPPARTPTAAQLRTRWVGTLRQVSGWQFAIRVVVGLAMASTLSHLWPGRHYTWIVLTVAILTQRPIEHLPVRLTQRTLGTTLGVALTWLVLIGSPPPFVLGLLICLLGTAAGLLRTRNYMAYAVAATPVILLVMDFGHRVGTGLLVDRLVATLVGAAIVVALNALLDQAVRRWPDRGPAR